MTVARPIAASSHGATPSRPRFGPAELLLCTWIALLGADRIDLFGGAVPVVVTPFLAMTPLVMVVEGVRRIRRRDPVRASSRTRWYILFSLLLLATVVLSVFGSGDTATSAARAVLLVAQMLGTLAVAMLASDRLDFERLLARGAAFGLVLYGVFDVLELLAYVGRQSEMLHLGPISIWLAPFTYGIVPRLAGPVNDPNRGGFVLLAYLFLVTVFGERGTMRRLGVAAGIVLLPLTISRSALVAGAVTYAVALLEPRWRRISPRVLLAGLVALSVTTTALLVSPGLREFVTVSAAPLAGRLDFQEQSAQDHFTLLERGLDVVSVSGARAATGIGYGSAYLVLQDIFPGNRYGNFHSLYVSMLAESGVFALVLTVLLLAVPMFRASRFRSVVAGAAVFSVFYQATSEPIFWFLLCLAWMSYPMIRARSDPLATP